MTYSEVLLWSRIKNKQLMGYDFDRQKPILNYIVDFFCKELWLAIEVDGITHADDGPEARKRQLEIEALGVHFLRFDALELVKNCDRVVSVIAGWIEAYEEEHGIADSVKARRKM
jgi:very-short-patch-repair endonuclease